MANKVYDSRTEAKKIVSKPINEIKDYFNQYFTESSVETIKLAKEVIIILRDEMVKNRKANEQFVELCNNSIKDLKKIIEDDKVTPEEKNAAQNNITTILTTINDFDRRTKETKKETIKQICNVAKDVSFVAGGIAVLKLCLENLPKLITYVAKK